MIERSIFEAYMSIIADAVNRKYSDPTIDLYYKLLSDRLTTPEFVTAAERFIYEGGFFSPAKLVELVQPKPEHKGLLMWEEIVKLSSRSTDSPNLDDRAAMKALAAIGGLKSVGYADTETKLPHLKRDFLKYYETYTSPAVEDRNFSKALQSAPIAYLAGGKG